MVFRSRVVHFLLSRWPGSCLGCPPGRSYRWCFAVVWFIFCYCREWLNGDHQDFFRGLPRSFREFCFLLTVCLRGAHDQILCGSLFFAGSLKQYALFSWNLHAILLNLYSFRQLYFLSYNCVARHSPHNVWLLPNILLKLYGLCQLHMSCNTTIVSCTPLFTWRLPLILLHSHGCLPSMRVILYGFCQLWFE